MQYSIPNEYSLRCTTSQAVEHVKTKRPPIQSPSSGGIAVVGSYGVSEGYEVQISKNEEEYEYADEDEFWEPASMEDELKCQLERVLEIPVINQDDLE